jgi:hypothetical protein
MRQNTQFVASERLVLKEREEAMGRRALEVEGSDHMMRRVVQTAIALVVGFCAVAAQAEASSIPGDQQDKKKIFWGTADSFSKPGRIDFQETIRATPEYKEIIEDKVERGSGKYWILMSQASDRVVKAVAHLGEESDYDLICAEGYLKGLNPPVDADDLTEKVIEVMEELMGD